MDTIPKILIVEDEAFLLELYVLEIEEDGDYEIFTAQSLEDAQTSIAQQVFDVVLADIMLQQGEHEGLDLLREVKSSNPDTQVILFTGIGGTEEARQAQKLGADGYLTKPLDYDQLRQVIRNAIAWRQQRIDAREKNRQRRERHLPTPIRFVFASRPMSKVVALAAKQAANDYHLLIIGGAGTGKGLIAEGIHNGSEREKFELINCGSLSEPTLERIIFGLDDEEDGIVARLHRGTLVLDNISKLSLRLQDMLIPIMVDSNYNGVECDIRIIGIDETDLSHYVDQGLFLEPLRTMLVTGGQLQVPPLRERHDPKYSDVLVLSTHFIQKYHQNDNLSSNDVRLSAEVEFIFENYGFPGNVRELENLIRSSIGKLESSDVIDLHHVPERLHRYGTQINLKVIDQSLKLLCPHGAFLCNQTENIANSYSTLNGMYINIASQDVRDIVLDLCTRKGLDIIDFANIQDPLTAMCSSCISVQSAHYAIVELTGSGSQFYELGMLHSMGVPTLIILKNISRVPPQFKNTSMMHLESDPIEETISVWLTENMEAGI